MSIFALMNSPMSADACKNLASVMSVMLELHPPVEVGDDGLKGQQKPSARDRRAVLHLYAPIVVNPRYAGCVFVMEARPLDGERTYHHDWFLILRPGDEGCVLPDVPLPGGCNAMGDVRVNCSLERGLYTRKLIRAALAAGKSSTWRWVQPLQRFADRRLR